MTPYHSVTDRDRHCSISYYFLNICIISTDYRDSSNKHLPQNDMNRERQIRDTLINLRYIAFTPSRYNNGQRLTNYDDRYYFID